jgi:hypothetical protein
MKSKIYNGEVRSSEEDFETLQLGAFATPDLLLAQGPVGLTAESGINVGAGARACLSRATIAGRPCKHQLDRWLFLEIEKRENKSEEPKTAEAILADPFSVRRVVYIDEHVFIRMSRQKAGKDFDEIFLRDGIRFHESLADVEPVRTLGAI